MEGTSGRRDDDGFVTRVGIVVDGILVFSYRVYIYIDGLFGADDEGCR